MKKFSFFAAALLLLSLFANATIRRVGYNGVARAGVDYADIASAQTASAAGDTIQLYGSTSGGTITKRLVFIGFGYNFDVNPNLQAIGGEVPSSISSALYFYPGSDSSIVEGFDGYFYVGNNNSGTAVGKVIFRRCRGYLYFSNNQASINDVKVVSCAFQSISMQYSAGLPVTNVQIYNTLFNTITMFLAGSSGSIINCATNSSTITSAGVNLSSAGFLVKNSIIANYNASSVNTVYESNFFGTAQPASLPPGSNNRWGQVWANLFSRTTTNDNASYIPNAEFDEDYYGLKSGSLAINGGTDSGGNPTDAGIYGGDPLYRYKLSGVPAVPAIYKLTASSTAASANPYNITVSVRSNN